MKHLNKIEEQEEIKAPVDAFALMLAIVCAENEKCESNSD